MELNSETKGGLGALVFHGKDFSEEEFALKHLHSQECNSKSCLVTLSWRSHGEMLSGPC